MKGAVAALARHLHPYLANTNDNEIKASAYNADKH